MDNYTFYIKIGEVGKQLVFWVKDADGAAVDLTGKTVKFTMSKGSEIPVNLGDCVPDADQATNTGKGVYTFGAEASALRETEYKGEICVIDGATVLFYPNTGTPLKNYITIKATKSLAVP